MKHHISISLLSLFWFQICQQKLFLANIDTRKEEFKMGGEDYQEPPEYIDDCSEDTAEVQSDSI